MESTERKKKVGPGICSYIYYVNFTMHFLKWNIYYTQPQGQPTPVKCSGFMSALLIPIVVAACNLKHSMSELTSFNFIPLLQRMCLIYVLISKYFISQNQLSASVTTYVN